MSIQLTHESCHHLIQPFSGKLPSTGDAIGLGHPCIEKSKVMVDLGEGSHRRPGACLTHELLNGNGRGQTLNEVSLRPFIEP